MKYIFINLVFASVVILITGCTHPGKNKISKEDSVRIMMYILK
jgi:hypothetical protein